MGKQTIFRPQEGQADATTRMRVHIKASKVDVFRQTTTIVCHGTGTPDDPVLWMQRYLQETPKPARKSAPDFPTILVCTSEHPSAARRRAAEEALAEVCSAKRTEPRLCADQSPRPPTRFVFVQTICVLLHLIWHDRAMQSWVKARIISLPPLTSVRAPPSSVMAHSCQTSISITLLIPST